MRVERLGNGEAREGVSVGDHPGVDASDHQSTNGGESLRPPENLFLLSPIRKQLGQPGDGRDEFHTHTNEGCGAKEHKLPHRRAHCGEGGRKRIQGDAACKNRPPPEAIGEPSAQKTENTSAQRGDPKHLAQPFGDQRIVHRKLKQLRHRRTTDQREHQQLIRVERESDDRDEDDQPGSQGQPGRHSRRIHT